MKNRKWASKQKLEIVLEGLKGAASIPELCNRYQIMQTQYYDWKNHFLRHGALPPKNQTVDKLNFLA